MSAERCNVGRIDHIILLYRNRENQQAARQKFTALLGIDDWQLVGEGDEGVDIVISWKSGIELMTPTRVVPAFERHFATHGEGFYCLVFGVMDLDQAIAHAKKITGRDPYVLPPAPGAVFDKFDVAREAMVGEIAGVRLMFGEFQAK